MYYKDEMSKLTEQFDEKQSKRLHLDTMISLIDKLNEKGIEDEKADAMILELKGVLENTKQDFKGSKSAFMSKLNKVMEHIRKEHELVEKGYYGGTYITVGIAIGVAIGAALMTSLGTAYMGAGLAIGIAFGAAIGGSMDKKAADKGLQY